MPNALMRAIGKIIKHKIETYFLFDITFITKISLLSMAIDVRFINVTAFAKRNCNNVVTNIV